MFSKHMEKSEQFTHPTIITIFGATGDLSTQKLIPALIDLYKKELLPENFVVVGISRREWSDERFQEFLRDTLNDEFTDNPRILNDFLSHARFQTADVTKLESYDVLYDRLTKIDEELGVCANKLFYLAMAPSFFESIINNFSDSSLMALCSDDRSWTRVLIEKPFGTNLETARKLDGLFSDTFAEDQLFRIDHYIAKDALQNLLVFRFHNILFEDNWNREDVESVHIKLHESGKAGNRGSFYDSVGAFRDVGQNHVLQLLALVAMDNPGKLEADAIQSAREKVFSDLHCMSRQEVADNIVRGQYEGFRNHKGVEDESDTETYFLTKAFVENDRWEGVPFFLESGKAMAEDKVEISVYFRKPEGVQAEEGKFSRDPLQNVLTLTFQPEERITLQICAKKPGLGFETEQREVSFTHRGEEEFPDAYEKILYHAFSGDRVVFATSQEVESAWEFATPILEQMNDLSLHTYKSGENGPDTRSDLLPYNND